MDTNESATAVLGRPAESPSDLVERLEATRTDYNSFHRLRCLLTASVAVLVLAALLAAADWLWILSTGVRAGGLLVLACVGIALLVRGFHARRKFGRPDAAVEVETAFPQLGQRV